MMRWGRTCITMQILLLILTSHVPYKFSYRAIDLNEVIFDASFSRNQELVVPQLSIRKNSQTSNYFERRKI